jgi:hypothetical protein
VGAEGRDAAKILQDSSPPPPQGAHIQSSIMVEWILHSMQVCAWLFLTHASASAVHPGVPCPLCPSSLTCPLLLLSKAIFPSSSRQQACLLP